MKTIAASLLTLAALSMPAGAAVVISTGATSHMTCTGGTCSPTAKNAVLNVSQLQTMLASSDVTVSTGSDALSIAISSPLTWTSTSRLTLNATQGVAIKAAVVVEGTGAVTIAASGDALNFYPGGTITFWDNASSLIIAGSSYTLVSDLATLASSVSANPSGFYAFAQDPPPEALFSNGVVLTPFSGTFEGLGHTINHIAISSQGQAGGIFAQTNQGSMLRDLNITRASMTCGTSGSYNGILAGSVQGGVDNVTVAGTMNCGGIAVGGLVGYLGGTGSISHSSAQVKVSGRFEHGGGLVGWSFNTISNSFASGNVSGPHGTAGGLAGVNEGMLQDSHATGDVTGANAGGLVGDEEFGEILRGYATGNVRGKFSAGGLAGVTNHCTVDSAFATGKATARGFAGGLIGDATDTTSLSNSYATGAVTDTGAGHVGGLVGLFERGLYIKTSWSSGAVSGTGAVNIGGFAGAVWNGDPVTSGYWDLDTSGISDPADGVGNERNYPGITGLTTAQFQSGLPAGFDPAIWAENAGINNGYPYLIANPPQ